VDNKLNKMSALALWPSYQAEITGSFSLHHSEMTIRKTDVFLAVSVCFNLAYLGPGGYRSAYHYEGPSSDPGKIMWDMLQISWYFGTRTSVPVANIISSMLYNHFFMQYRTV
jgi:hypothetical protein